MRTRIKICCIANPGEAEMAAAAGADLIGMVGPMPTGPGVLSLRDCAEVTVLSPAWVTPVLLSSSEDCEGLVADIRNARVRAIQIVRHIAPKVHDDLRMRMPSVRRLQVIHVEGPEALDLIPVYGDRVDAFLLDSGKVSADQLGGTGRVHDWSISAEFVRRSPVPVFLAGGLTPENAAEAIRQVGPFGLDICSGLRTDDKLDHAKLTAFMTAVRAAQ